VRLSNPSLPFPTLTSNDVVLYASCGMVGHARTLEVC